MQVPTSFQAVIDNTGPAADTYNLTFPTVPAGFTVLNSDTSATIPAGATGILGIYLQPSGTLPLPGTAESFSVTATSATTSSITQTVTETFDMPPVYAVTVTDNPTSLNTTPGAPVQTTLTITNVGNETYDAAVSPTLPSGWTISGGNTPVSLAVGASTSETVTITPPANAPLNSLQNVTLAYGQGEAQNAVSVTAVTPNPSTVEAGTPVDVTAGILAGVTQAEQGTVSYSVTTSQGTINSTPVAISLPEVIGLSTIDLGNLNTANLSPGTYTINVTVNDAGGNVIATGQGEVFVDAPIAATQSLSTSTLAPTSGTVTNTLSIAAQAQLGQVATDSQAASVVTSGNYAYSIGTSDITIVNVSNPSSPTVVGTFGSGTLNSVSTNLGALAGNDLVVASSTASGTFNFLVYSLANPTSPTLLSNTAINYQIAEIPYSLFVQGTTAYVVTDGIDWSGAGPSTITDQNGDLLAIDFSTPASPSVVGSLISNATAPSGGTGNINGAAAVSSSLAYSVGSTSTGSATQAGSGQLQVVNIANPATLAVTDTLTIPNSVQAIAVAVQGNQALVVGTTGGWESPFENAPDNLTGNITLTLLNIANPADPVILTSTSVSGASVSSAGTVDIVALGGGQFAISDVLSNGAPVVLVVDGSHPASLGVTTFSGAGAVSGMAVSGGVLYASTAAGLSVYQAGSITNMPATVTVQVPTTTGVSIVANSFNVAPTQIATGATSETLTWNFSSPAAIPSGGITWQTSIANLQAGQALPVTLGTTVQYTALGAAGSENLPPLVVAGLPAVQTLTVPVEIAAPGVAALADAAAAANQVGNTNLANQFNDLSTALTGLVQTPTSTVYLSEAQAAITSIVSQLLNDPFLSPFAASLTAASAALGAATTASQINTALVNLGDALESLAQAISDEAAFGFTIRLADSAAEAESTGPSVFDIDMTNNGSQTATYNFSVSGLPANVTATFSQSSVTLAAGASISTTTPVTVSFSESGATLTAFSFTVTATAQEASEITQGTTGQVVLRPEVVLVGAVTPGPLFTNAGGQVNVSVKIESSLNESRQFAVSYSVPDGKGTTITSTPVTVTLGITSVLTTVNLGNLDTTPFANGTYAITVMVADQSSQPLPTATGQGSLVIGSPVTGSISTTPSSVPTGASTVTTTVQVNTQASYTAPLTLDGAVATPAPGTSVALYQSGGKTYAYESGTGGMDIINVTNPDNPQYLGTFGQDDVTNGQFGFNVIKVVNGELLVGTSNGNNGSVFNLLVYSLTSPTSPTLVSNTTINYRFLNDMLVNSTGTDVYVPTSGFEYYGDSIFQLFGDFVAIDLSNPTKPVLASSLYNNEGQPDGGDLSQFGGTLVNDSLAYLTGLTPGGSDVTNNTGNLTVVNVANPDAMSVVTSLTIPGTINLVNVAVDGNMALVVGTAGTASNVFDPSATGVANYLTLTVLNISNPDNPQIVSTLVTNEQYPVNEAGAKTDVVSLGNGDFAVSDNDTNGSPSLLVVEPQQPPEHRRGRHAGAFRGPRHHGLGHDAVRHDLERAVDLPDRAARQRPGGDHGRFARGDGREHRLRFVQLPADANQHLVQRRQPGLGSLVRLGQHRLHLLLAVAAERCPGRTDGPGDARRHRDLHRPGNARHAYVAGDLGHRHVDHQPHSDLGNRPTGRNRRLRRPTLQSDRQQRDVLPWPRQQRRDRKRDFQQL